MYFGAPLKRLKHTGYGGQNYCITVGQSTKFYKVMNVFRMLLLVVRRCGAADKSGSTAWSLQRVETGAGRCTMCWHRLDECGPGSDGVEGQDGCDDLVEKNG